MTGAEHYAEAERLTARAELEPNADTAANMLRCAQVHATLALAAASARRTQSAMFTTSQEWLELVGV